MELRELAWKPLFPEEVDQGDPYILRVPDGIISAWRYYVYCSGEGGRERDAFPVYASNDLEHWERLPRNALRANLTWAFWAPCVVYCPGLIRPWVMLYSHSIGLGEEAHVGHRIYRADALDPEGPFEPSGHVLSGDFDFAIDPDVFRDEAGRLMLAFATDYVEEPPLGTGLAMAHVSEDLTKLLEPHGTLARAAADWQVYDPARVMEWKRIPGVDWSRDRVCWYTLEGPCGGLTSPGGREVILYSGGCYFGFYAVAALVREGRDASEDGGGNRPGTVYRDMGAERKFVLEPRPERGIFGPGHCSVTRAPGGETVVLFHARYGRDDALRQMSLAPLEWNDEDLPFCPGPEDQA